MKLYFQVIQKPKLAKPRGRPPKRKATRTNIPPTELNIPAPVPAPASSNITEGAAPVVVGFEATDNQQKKKKSRTNWGKGENRVKMAKAIHDWSKKEGDIYDDNGEMIDDWKVFANRLDIPLNSFYKYIQPNDPRQIGDGSRGKKRLMKMDEIKFAGCVLARSDHGNDGLSSKEAVDMMSRLWRMKWQVALVSMKITLGCWPLITQSWFHQS